MSELEAKVYYLGQYGTESSKREYDRIIAEFVANGRRSAAPTKFVTKLFIAATLPKNTTDPVMFSSIPLTISYS